METLVFLMMAVLGSAMAVAVVTYYFSNKRLQKARVVDSEVISLLLSLCSFGMVITVAYFTVLDSIISKW